MVKEAARLGAAKGNSALSARSPPELLMLLGGKGCVKDTQILLNPGANNCQTSGIPALPFPSTEEKGENLLTFL